MTDAKQQIPKTPKLKTISVAEEIRTPAKINAKQKIVFNLFFKFYERRTFDRYDFKQYLVVSFGNKIASAMGRRNG